jgi:hypothetical protein
VIRYKEITDGDGAAVASEASMALSLPLSSEGIALWIAADEAAFAASLGLRLGQEVAIRGARGAFKGRFIAADGRAVAETAAVEVAGGCLIPVQVEILRELNPDRA